MGPFEILGQRLQKHQRAERDEERGRQIGNRTRQELLEVKIQSPKLQKKLAAQRMK